MTPEPMIVQHDDRAIYHRRRWARTGRSETASAWRTVSNTRTDAIGDAVMIARGVQGELETIPLDAITWKYLFGRCGTKAAIRPHNAKVVICALFTTRNSLKSQGRRKVFSPIRKVRAISQKLYSHSGTTAVKSP